MYRRLFPMKKERVLGVSPQLAELYLRKRKSSPYIISPLLCGGEGQTRLANQREGAFISGKTEGVLPPHTPMITIDRTFLRHSHSFSFTLSLFFINPSFLFSDTHRVDECIDPDIDGALSKWGKLIEERSKFIWSLFKSHNIYFGVYPSDFALRWCK